jgi:sensor histidine kinase YesM
MIVSLLTFIIEAIKYSCGYYLCFSKRIARIWPFFAGGAAFLVLPNIVSLNRTETNILTAFLVLCLLLFCIDARGYQRFFRLVFLFFVMAFLDGVGQKIFIDSYSLVAKTAVNAEYEYLLNVGISCIVVAALSLIKCFFPIKQRIKTNKPMRRTIHILVVAIGIIMLFVATGFQFLSRLLDDNRLIVFATIITLISYLGIGGLGLFVAYTNKMNSELEKQMETEQQLSIMREKYYQALLEKEAETKMYRHDLNNHLICLSEIAKSGNPAEMSAYIGRLQERIVDIQNKAFFTGCDVLDIFINYFTQSLDADVTVEVKGKCAHGLAASDVDICVVFSNLLQNAAEYLNQQKQGNKYLRIEVKEGAMFLQVQIVNSWSEDENQTERFGTTKKDIENHGYGLKNVAETVKLNGGCFSIEIDNNECIASVTLPINKLSDQ